jgi:hypothetical protein
MTGDEASIARLEPLERLLRGDLGLRVLGESRTKVISAYAQDPAGRRSQTYQGGSRPLVSAG